MAGSSIIGALRVVLGLDSASMETGVKQASKSLLSFEKSAKSLQGGMSGLQKVMAAVAVGAFGAFIKKSINAGDEIAKTSKRLGIAADAYQELSYAAGLAGISQEEFDKSLEQFNKRMGDFSGNTTEAQKALGQLGISFDQLKGQSPDKQIKLIADGFQRLGVTQETATISTDLFGKAGQKMIGLLIEGSSGLNKYAEEARRLGFVLGTDVLDASEQANDEFDRIGKALKVAGIQIAAGFLPGLQAIRDVVTSQAFQDGVRALAAGFADLVKWMVENRQVIGTVAAAFLALKTGATIGAIFGPAGALIGGATGALLGAAAASQLLKTRLEELEAEYKQTSEAIKEIEGSQDSWIQSGLRAARMTSNLGVEQLPALRAQLIATRKEINDLEVAQEEANQAFLKPAPVGGGGSNIADIAKIVDDLRFKTALTRGEFKGLADGFAELAKGKVSIEDLKKGVDGLTGGWTLVNLEVAKYNIAKAVQEEKPQWQQDLDAVEKLRLSYQLTGQGAEVLATKTAKAAASMADAWGTAAESIVGPMASAFKDLASINKKYAGAAKALAIGEALVQTFLGATKAFTAFAAYPPLAIAAAAAATAAGLANVAKISATEFAHGGSFRVGGSGGMDSQMINFMATPGEMVDVRTPGTTGSTGSGSTEVTLRGRRLTDMLTLDDLRDLIDSLNSANRDGYKLKVAT
jgi:hypothetical protein